MNASPGWKYFKVTSVDHHQDSYYSRDTPVEIFYLERLATIGTMERESGRGRKIKMFIISLNGRQMEITGASS